VQCDCQFQAVNIILTWSTHICWYNIAVLFYCHMGTVY